MILKKSFLSFLKGDSLVRAMLNTNRYLLTCTKIAFGSSLLPFPPPGNDSKRTNHDTHPAAYTLVLMTNDRPCFGIPMQASSHTGLKTRGIFTMPTLKSKGQISLLLHQNPRQRLGKLSLISLDDLL